MSEKDKPKTGGSEPGHDMLDAMFDQARMSAPELPPALAARMLADGLGEQAQRALTCPADQRERVLGSFVRQIFDGIGGWPALAGMVSATVAGVWFGVSPPDIIAQQTSWFIGQGAMGNDLYLVDVASAFDTIIAQD